MITNCGKCGNQEAIHGNTRIYNCSKCGVKNKITEGKTPTITQATIYCRRCRETKYTCLCPGCQGQLSLKTVKQITRKLKPNQCTTCGKDVGPGTLRGHGPDGSPKYNRLQCPWCGGTTYMGESKKIDKFKDNIKEYWPWEECPEKIRHQCRDLRAKGFDVKIKKIAEGEFAVFNKKTNKKCKEA